MRLATGFWILLLFVALFQISNAQDASKNMPCDQVHAIARMARAKSLSALVKAESTAGNSYRAQIVFRARSFELRPNDRNAALSLLNLIPQDDPQHGILVTLGESLCDDEMVAEMFAMSRISDHLAHDFARAVLLVPDMLPRYLAYGSISVQDPHSDYDVQMQTVCRAKHSKFEKAVEELPPDQRDWFVKHVFNPDGCRAIALPESD